MNLPSHVRCFPDTSAAVDACGEQILAWLAEAIAARGQAFLAISGGSSPKPMFQRFARTDFAWDRVSLFLVDERCVPIDDPQSNFRMTREAWLAAAHYPESKIHRVHTEATPEEAARAYADDIRAAFELSGPALPQFDVIHRGMGPDGHTASLFPGSAPAVEPGAIAAAVYVEKLHQWRVTLTAAVLEAARHTAILATGADKAPALEAVLRGPSDIVKYPAQIASREGSNAVWFVDQTAAGPAAT